jgi:hypothetical protein
MRSRQEDLEVVTALLGGRIKLASEEVTGAGAVVACSLEVPVTRITSTGADVLTLADGSQGQVKIFIHDVDGGSVIITPTNFAGASSTTVTMVTAGDCVAFIFLGTSWYLLWSTPNIEGTPLVIA